ncbi:hypothetical protein BaRGS_00022608 [Batillaria attramentaria]|uniref:G-protein coupled receptors family 1 profile domain-containing protein n=1 Tax=Batillaria attramentaria TaxID=370345 RepID=A0ABD0KGY3_9CAEN
MDSIMTTATFFTIETDVTLTAMNYDAELNNTSPGMADALPDGCLYVRHAPGQNTDDLVSAEFQRSFSKFLRAALLTVMFVIGSPMNIMNMVVFVKHGLKERINLCLFCLSFSDFTVIFAHFIWGLDWAVRDITGDYTKYPVYRVFINNYIIALAGFIYVSSFMSTVIACERWACVVSPIKAKTIISTKTMGVIIFCAHVIILGAHFIIAAKWRIVCLFDPETGLTLDAISSSQFFRENYDLVNAFDGIVFGVLIPGLCLTGVTVATAGTVLKLKQLAAWREQSSSAATLTSRDVALTRMLIGISVLFIVCTTPGFVFHTAIMFVPGLSVGGKYSNTFSLLINIQQLCTYINSSVNFFVYLATGTKYRETVRAMFCRPADPTNRSMSVETTRTTA